MATVFIAALSDWVDLEMERVARAWAWATRLMACHCEWSVRSLGMIYLSEITIVLEKRTRLTSFRTRNSFASDRARKLANIWDWNCRY